MEPIQQFGRTLLLLGAVFLAVGALLSTSGGKLLSGWAGYRGDIVHRGQHGTFDFPVVSCLVISVLLTLILWIVNQFRR